MWRAAGTKLQIRNSDVGDEGTTITILDLSYGDQGARLDEAIQTNSMQIIEGTTW